MYAKAAIALESCPLYIDATPAISIPQAAMRARRLKRRVGLDLVVVDYLQLMRSVDVRPGSSRVAEVYEITRGLKALAKDLDVPVIALSQLSRQVEQREDKRPMLSDLHDSGAIEQDADVVMFVYRKEYYLQRSKPEDPSGPGAAKWKAAMDAAAGRAEIIVAKHRNGPVGTATLAFDSEFTRFSDGG